MIEGDDFRDEVSDAVFLLHGSSTAIIHRSSMSSSMAWSRLAVGYRRNTLGHTSSTCWLVSDVLRIMNFLSGWSI